MPPSASARVPHTPWTARWIAHPEATPQGAGVFHFRKTLELGASPGRFVVHVSADNRYRLFVNGTSVAMGPAFGSIMRWRYESVDLAPYLRAGSNVIGATVWNWGDLRPAVQSSLRTAFLMQSEEPANRAVDSGTSWKVTWNRAWRFTPVQQDVAGYYAAAPGESMDASLHPWGWEQPGFDDSQWPDAIPAGNPLSRGSHPFGEAVDWQLVPRTIPPMEERPIRMAEVRHSEGITATPGFVAGKAPLTIPERSKVSLLLDQRELTMGHPVLVASGGRGATATLTFAEGLVDSQGHKGNRDEIAGKTIKGLKDRITFDGGEHRRFQSLWLRTWRYVQIDVETQDEPLRIDDVSAVFTAYPFSQRAAFTSDRKWIENIWNIDWRVFRLSAFETFWDTPYYEQLQYVGDTRIESLLALYNTGDDRLVRNAIEQFDETRIPEGLTASRYSPARPQYIPPFSLWWVAMIHDHWLYRGDAAFSRQFLPGIRGVIGWYERHLDDTGQLGPMPWWNFLDWSRAFERGVAPDADDGHSTALTLQLAYVLRLAGDLERSLGSQSEGDRYLALAERLNAAARAQSWDPSRGLFADTPDKRSFSQHTNSLAVLSGAVPPPDRAAVMRRVLTDQDLAQASYYFRFYVDEALREAGLADGYLAQLEPWREMLRLGLTTTLEEPEPSRSDSHAWSAHPNYHLLATVLGIRPAEPGFRSVTIAPALGDLKHASGRVPTPAGDIVVRFERRGSTGVEGVIELPPNTRGTFIWAAQASPLKEGSNRVRH